MRWKGVDREVFRRDLGRLAALLVGVYLVPVVPMLAFTHLRADIPGYRECDDDECREATLANITTCARNRTETACPILSPLDDFIPFVDLQRQAGIAVVATLCISFFLVMVLMYWRERRHLKQIFAGVFALFSYIVATSVFYADLSAETLVRGNYARVLIFVFLLTVLTAIVVYQRCSSDPGVAAYFASVRHGLCFAATIFVATVIAIASLRVVLYVVRGLACLVIACAILP